jgi:hypothetical protein
MNSASFIDNAKLPVRRAVADTAILPAWCGPPCVAAHIRAVSSAFCGIDVRTLKTPGTSA